MRKSLPVLLSCLVSADSGDILVKSPTQCPVSLMFFLSMQFFFLTMLRQHSQYDSRLGFSFRVLVRVRVRLGLG